jgi:hypothetical protein
LLAPTVIFTPEKFVLHETVFDEPLFTNIILPMLPGGLTDAAVAVTPTLRGNTMV